MICEAAVSSGLQGVEWAIGTAQSLGADDTASRAERIWKTTSDRGLAVCGLSAQGGDALAGPIGSFERLVEIAVAIRATQLRVFAPPYAGGAVNDELDRLSEVLADRVSVATAHGVALLVEMAPGTLVPGPEWLVRVGGRLPGAALGALYDPGSMMIEGHVAPVLAVGILGRRLHHVHVKDVAPRRVDRAWRWVHTKPGTGLVPWPEVLGALAASRYGGWFVLDHLSGPPASAKLRTDLGAFRALLRASEVVTP